MTAPPLTAAKVTIVVLNWNRAADTITCVESLAEADLGGASLLVVDNGSRDGSVAALRAQFPALKIVALPENLGFAGGNNAGMRTALEDGAEGILLLNNDTRVAPDFLPSLIEAMNSSPWSGAVSSAVRRLDKPDILDVAYVQVRFEQRNAVQIMGVNALPGEGFDRRLEVEVAAGCSLLMKAEALRTVGLFDEAYFAYHEDVDWCIRARKAGYQIFYEPYSRVFHRGSGSTVSLRRRPADDPSQADEPQLANAEPLPWNPVRTYLGIRNTIRLLNRYANKKQRIAFARACLRELPLEFTAAVLNRRTKLRLGHWTYGIFARAYFIERHPLLRRRPRHAPEAVLRALALGVLPVVDLVWSLPRDVLRAWRRGWLVEYGEYLRGLRDGVLGRRLPLRRLGLR